MPFCSLNLPKIANLGFGVIVGTVFHQQFHDVQNQPTCDPSLFCLTNQTSFYYPWGGLEVWGGLWIWPIHPLRSTVPFQIRCASTTAVPCLVGYFHQPSSRALSPVLLEVQMLQVSSPGNPRGTGWPSYRKFSIGPLSRWMNACCEFRTVTFL